MARNNIRHLPVTKSGQVLGMLTATDLIRHQSHTPIYLINEIHRAVTVEALIDLSGKIPATLVSLVRNSLTAYDIAHAISSIGEAITQRLIHFAEAAIGPPPISYAWIVAGSLARNEQTVHSDQDNALILSDEFDAVTHDDYFQKLSKSVSDGLNACGYVYCPGEVMATTQKWRQPQSVWRGYFNRWINSPEQKALMYSSIFFDLRCVHGDQNLLETLRQDVLEQSRGNTIFLAHMASNALQFHPPLGLFRRFVLEKGGIEEKALNMKKRGVVPIADLARVYALAAGVSALNTQDRLEAAADAGTLSQSGKADLLDAFEFIGTVRLEHQAAQIESGKAADNFVSPEQLSSLERRHLKDAFEVVRIIQASMLQTFQAGNIA
jgi:CBS domain-containing protein